MELFLIKSYKHLSLYKKEWSDILASNVNTNPFLEHEFIYTWWTELASDKTIEIYAVRENMKVVAFFPFEIIKNYGIVMMKLLAIEESPYMDFIVRSRDLERIMMFVLDGIILNKKEVIFHIDSLDIDGATHTKLNNYIKARSLKSFFQTDQPPKQDISRNRDKLEALGTLSEEIISLANLEAILKPARNNYTLSKTFNPDFLKRFEEGKFYQVRLIKLEEEIISFSIEFLCRGNYLEYANGYLKVFKIFQPDKVFIRKTFQRSTISHKFSSNNLKGKFSFIRWSLSQNRYKKIRNTDKRIYQKLLQKKHTILIAELTDSKVQAPTNHYKEITNEEIRSTLEGREERFYFYWHDFNGYYASDLEKAFWVNTNDLLIRELQFEKKLPADTIYVSRWENERLESILHLIQTMYKSKNVVVHISKVDKKQIKKLKLFGFMLKEKHVISQARVKEVN